MLILKSSLMVKRKLKVEKQVNSVNGSIAAGSRIVILDYIRALAIIRIFLYHYFMEWFGGKYYFVPEGLLANLNRMWIFNGAGVVGDVWGVLAWAVLLFKNFFSWIFIYGFATVNVFLVVSGFVLTYSLLGRGGDLLKAMGVSKDGSGKLHAVKKTVYGWILFNWKRLKRLIVPFYISVLAGILFWWGRNLMFPQFADWPLFGWMDLGKLLVFPYIFFDIELVQKFNGDYWFIVLILQLYLVFPVLFYLLKKAGVWNFLLVVAGLTFAYRFYAAFNLDGVPSGVVYPSEHSYRPYSFFLPRMFEFSFGMALGYLYFYNNAVLESLKKARWFWLGLIATLAGYVLLMYRWGWIFSDAVLGAGLFLVFYWLADRLAAFRGVRKFMHRTGESAYELYLWHHYFLNYFLMYLILVLGLKGNEWVFWGVMPVYFVCLVMMGRFGKYLTLFAEKLYSRLRGGEW